MELQLKRLKAEAILPARRTDGAAGYDLFAPLPFEISVHDTIRINLGWAMAIPQGYCGIIKSRSGVAYGDNVEASNAGVIDSDYRGDVGVILRNMHLKKSRSYNRGQAIAQLLIVPVASIPVKEVDAFSQTKRGTGGFGSTDRQKSRDASPVRGQRVDARPYPTTEFMSKAERKALDPIRATTHEQCKILLEWGVPPEELEGVTSLYIIQKLRKIARQKLEEGSTDLRAYRAAIDIDAICAENPNVGEDAKQILKIFKVEFPEDVTDFEALGHLADASITRGPRKLARKAAKACVDIRMRDPLDRVPEFLYY